MEIRQGWGRLAGTALVAAVMLASAWPAEADPGPAAGASLTYRIYVGGVLAVETDAALRLDQQGYDLDVSSRTRGMLDWLLGWSNRMVTQGLLAAAGPVPRLHRERGELRGKPRSVALDYRPGGQVDAVLDPQPETDDRDPVTADQRAGTEDILTAIVAVAESLAHGGGCAADRRIFDGRRRFDAVVTDGGMQALPPTTLGMFAGPARLCSATIRRIAGYARRPSDMDHPDYRHRPIQIWVAPVVAGGLPVPVRMEADSGLGSIVVHLTGAAPLLESPARELAQLP